LLIFHFFNLGFCKEIWETTISILEAKIGAFDFTAFDFRGHGDSSPITENEAGNWETFAKDVMQSETLHLFFIDIYQLSLKFNVQNIQKN
jgi:pimeloyl-ACP methyl ester carboxylesterase